MKPALARFAFSILFSGGFLLLILLGAFSCASHRLVSNEKLQGLKNSFCAPPLNNSPIPFLRPEEGLRPGTGVDLPAHKLSEHDVLMSRAAGVHSLLSNLLISAGDTGFISRLRVSELRQQVLGRILELSVQIQAVSAELDCEGERVEQVANYLDKLNSKRNNGLIIASVILAALTTGAAALISDNDLNKGVALSGGLVSAGLSALTIRYSGKRIEFLHPRNLLQDIWADSLVTGHYPPAIWYILQEEKFSNSGQVTLAHHLKSRWLQFEFNGKPDKKEELLIFGIGGIYSAEDLHKRSALINQLQSTIRSIQQDLASLVFSVNNLK